MKTKIQILGPGCAKCKLLAEHAERAAQELGLDYELEKLTAIERIVDFGVMATPALVVDGEIKVFGHVPSTPRLKTILAGSRAAS
jgi:small redox-active disulfide protein 2